MKLHEHFLKQDLEDASKEFHCFKDCVEISLKHINDGRIDLAEERMQDANHSLAALSMLYKRKSYIEYQRKFELCSLLQGKGADIQVVRGGHIHDPMA